MTYNTLLKVTSKSFYNTDNPKVKEYIKQLVTDSITWSKNYKGNTNSINTTISNFEFGGLLNTYKEINTNGSPLLVIWGDKDVVCPFIGMDIIKSTLKNLKTVVLHDCGHLDLWVINKYKNKMYNSTIQFFNNVDHGI